MVFSECTAPLMLSDNRRHLVRLWLRDPELAWETPEPLTDTWNRIYKDVKPENSVFPLEPRVRSASDGKPDEKPDEKYQ